MTDRNRLDPRRNDDSDRGRERGRYQNRDQGRDQSRNQGRNQGREHARFGQENDRDSYGSERWNDQDYGRRSDNDRNRDRQSYASEQDYGADDFSFGDSDYDRGSSPDRTSAFRSGRESTRQFQSSGSPFRGNDDNDRMARTGRGGSHLGGQMSDSIYGRDEPYQGNDIAGGGFGNRGRGGYGDQNRSGGYGDQNRSGGYGDQNRSGSYGDQNRSSYGSQTSSDYGSQSPGGFAGRGPKGYERSDERIKEEVSEHLADHDNIDASEIDVKVSKGEVTLSGSVSERRTKRLAEDVAEGVKGVKDVHNQIRVDSGTFGKIGESIQSAVSNLTGTSDQSDKPSSQTQASKSKNDGPAARH